MAERHSTDFHVIFAFLADYWWIHGMQLTKYFVEQIWSKIPEQWNKVLSRLSAEQLGRLPFEVSAQGSPCIKCMNSPCMRCMLSHSDGHVEESLASFLQRSAQLSCGRQQASCFLSSTPIDREQARGMSSKKVHEVEWMASLVHSVAAESGCDVVVDVGSGLGYLGQVLHKVYGLPVIGVEGNIGHTEGAAIRASRQGMECSGLKTVALEIRDDKENFQKFTTVISEALSSLLPCQHTSSHLEKSESLVSKIKSKHHNTDRRVSEFARKPGCFWPDSYDSSRNFEETESAERQGRTQCYQTEYCRDCSGRGTTSRCCDADCYAGLDKLALQKTIIEHSQFPEDITKTEFSCSSHDVRNTRLLNHGYRRIASEGCEDQLTCAHKHRGCKDHCEDGHSIVEDKEMARDIHFCKARCASGNVSCSCKKKMDDMKRRKVCLVGLHCCGDLSPVMLKLFHHVEFIGAVICVSCCYHKMRKISGKDGFCNFPLSESAKQAYETVQKSFSNSSFPLHFLSASSLRLAAQETRTRWATQSDMDHESHTRNLAYRALLEVFLTETQQALVPDRKRIRKLNYSNFDTFVKSFLTSLPISEDKKKDMERELERVHFQLQPHFQSIEPFTCLQVVLQPVLESLIVWDRDQWLIEQGYQPSILPIFDPDISPRNLASVCIKD